MRILITGSSNGIGKQTALKFLREGHEVIGIDIEDSTIEDKNYRHIKENIISDKLPKIDKINILVNNAGCQTPKYELKGNEDIDVNLKGTINVTQKYGLNNKDIKSVVFITSASWINGAEFPIYASSKAGILAYMKYVAGSIAKYGATSNSISPGGVLTRMNKHIMEDEKLLKEVYDETLLNKWANPEEIAEFVYFMTCINKSMTGQDILVDNGEILKSNFVW